MTLAAADPKARRSGERMRCRCCPPHLDDSHVFVRRNGSPKPLHGRQRPQDELVTGRDNRGLRTAACAVQRQAQHLRLDPAPLEPEEGACLALPDARDVSRASAVVIADEAHHQSARDRCPVLESHRYFQRCFCQHRMVGAPDRWEHGDCEQYTRAGERALQGSGDPSTSLLTAPAGRPIRRCATRQHPPALGMTRGMSTDRP